MPSKYDKKTQYALSDDNARLTEEEIPVSQVLYEILATVLMSLVVLLLLMTFFVRQVTVDGSSMNDTLQHEDRLMVSCFNYTPKYGDVVIVTHGAALDEPIVKRVIATEGQYLDIDFATGEVSVDGVLMKENYIIGTTRSLPDSMTFPMVIPEGYVFVMGDNREGSLDSRSQRIGLVPVENIIGKAFLRWYPLDNLSVL